MASLPGVRVQSLTEFLDQVFAHSDEDNCLYRGQRRSSWDLTPKLGRLPLRESSTVPEVEKVLIDEFKRQCIPHLSRELIDEWEVLAMAQHHGLATRLLDWTTNPLAALWFAVREPALDRDYAVVLMLQPEAGDFVEDRAAASPYTIRKTRFFQPSHLNPRIVAQSGWFSVHYWNKSSDHFSRVDRIANYRNRLHRLHIAPKYFSEIRARLDRVGLNEASLFPGLDGLSNHLNWMHSVLDDEADPK